MRFLFLNITHQFIELTVPDGEATVTDLPEKRAILIRLRLDPGGGGFLNFLEQFGLRDRATQPHREMNAVSYTADSVCLALGISANGGEIGMDARPNLGVEQGLAFFAAEDNVNENLTE
jgi:hypothetical protein